MRVLATLAMLLLAATTGVAQSGWRIADPVGDSRLMPLVPVGPACPRSDLVAVDFVPGQSWTVTVDDPEPHCDSTNSHEGIVFEAQYETITHVYTAWLSVPDSAGCRFDDVFYRAKDGSEEGVLGTVSCGIHPLEATRTFSVAPPPDASRVVIYAYPNCAGGVHCAGMNTEDHATTRFRDRVPDAGFLGE